MLKIFKLTGNMMHCPFYIYSCRENEFICTTLLRPISVLNLTVDGLIEFLNKNKGDIVTDRTDVNIINYLLQSGYQFKEHQFREYVRYVRDFWYKRKTKRNPLS
jgi:hypothetical protein